MIPEDCILVAHNTGDGWYLAVEDKEGNEIAILAWPFGDHTKTSKDLEGYGFKIV